MSLSFLRSNLSTKSSVGLCLPLLLALGLAGCDTSTTEPTAEHTDTEHAHDEHEHDEHEHDEHEHDEHEHDEHGHDEHEHDEHEHDEHGHDEHDHDEHGHDEHGHDEHEHDEHGHDEHGHDEHGHDEHDHDHDHDHHALSAGQIQYHCSPEQTIIASYDSSSQPRRAHLLIDGIEYDLTASTVSKNADNMDAVYLSEIGLDDTHGLVWQTTQDNATLTTPDLDKLHTADTLTPLLDCHKI